MTIQELMLGGDGTELITGTVTGKQYAYLVVNAAATFTTLTDTAGRDMRAAVSNAGGLGISSTEIKEGMIIKAKGQNRIAAVTVSAGSVFGVLDTHT